MRGSALAEDNVHGHAGNAGAGEIPLGIQLVGAVFGVGVKNPLDQMDARENIAIAGVFADGFDVQLFPMLRVVHIVLKSLVAVERPQFLLLAGAHLGEAAKTVVFG